MRSIRYALGIAALAAATVIAIVAQGASGDAIYALKPANTGLLDAGQRTALKAAVVSAWPDVSVPDIKSEYCRRASGKWVCRGRHDPGLSDAQYLELRLSGKIPAAGSLAQDLPEVALDEAQVALHDTAAQAIFGVPLAGVRWYRCKRFAAGIACDWSQIVTAPPADFRAAEAAGQVAELIGVVE